MKSVAVEQAVRAQKALREAAALGPEVFPIQAFIGMISDEIELLRSGGKTDQEIADMITTNSDIEITASEIAENYAPAETRRQAHYEAG